jgi:phosphomannomutase
MQGDQKSRFNCFTAYDVRGRVPGELNEEIAFKIGQGFVTFLKARQVVVGYDIRLSSPALSAALSQGLTTSGAEVLDIGMCGTEEVYFATSALNADGGIMVTASHNPAEYNGMKFVRSQARPISSDTGLLEIQKMMQDNTFIKTGEPGRIRQADIRNQYIEHVLGYIDPASLKPLKAVVNAGNGCAGPVIDLLEGLLPITLVKLQHEPDGTFPHGVPNPLLPENRKNTARAVREEKADIGIVHDPRLVWNTREIVTREGSIPIMAKTGHAFIKEIMRAEDALYGGEMSGHHYFRDFNYCDSGMIPWLLVWQLMSRKNMVLSEMVAERMALYPVSGEINRSVADPDAILARIEKHFQDTPCEKDHTDGLSVSCDTFRVNVRKSNTEPVLRLNVESRADQKLMEEKTAELLALIEG